MLITFYHIFNKKAINFKKFQKIFKNLLTKFDKRGIIIMLF